MDILIEFLRKPCILVSCENHIMFCENCEIVQNSIWPCILYVIIILLACLIVSLIFIILGIYRY